MRLKAVQVTWLDAQRGDEAPAPGNTGVERKTVGWLVEESPDHVTIAMSYDEGSFERWFTIPTAYVREIRPLKGAL